MSNPSLLSSDSRLIDMVITCIRILSISLRAAELAKVVGGTQTINKRKEKDKKEISTCHEYVVVHARFQSVKHY